MALLDFFFKRQSPLQAAALSVYYDSPSAKSWLLAGKDPYTIVQFNPVSARCVDKIAQAAADYPLEVYVKGAIKTDHPLVKVLNGRVGQGQSGWQMKYAVAALIKTYGGAYLKGTFVSSGLAEITQVMPPSMVKPLYDEYTMESGFEVSTKSGPVLFKIEKNGACSLKRVGAIDPTDRTKHVSPADMAMKSIEENNSNRDYSRGMFERFGRRPAVMTLPDGTQAPTDDEWKMIKARLESHSQQDPSGRVPQMISGGVTYQELGASSADMQTLDNRAATAREICFVLGVPPMLMGIEGDSTYSNQAEANASFCRDTTRPLVNMLCAALTEWVSMYYGGNIEIRADVSGDGFAAAERATNWERIGKAEGLTVNEKRDLMGYGRTDEITETTDGDAVFVNGGLIPLSEAVTPVLVGGDGTV